MLRRNKMTSCQFRGWKQVGTDQLKNTPLLVCAMFFPIFVCHV